MDDREQNSDERRFCGSCWAEFGPADALCPLCRSPGPPVGQAELEHGPEELKSGGTGIGVSERQLRRRSLIAVLACALVLTGTVAWLELQVNAFHHMRAELGRPRVSGPDGAPALTDFAGRWRVIEGSSGSDRDRFEFVMRKGELVLPLGADAPAAVFQLEDGRLRGTVEVEQMKIDMIVVPADNMREMTIWLYPSKGTAVKLRAIRVWEK